MLIMQPVISSAEEQKVQLPKTELPQAKKETKKSLWQRIKEAKRSTVIGASVLVVSMVASVLALGALGYKGRPIIEEKPQALPPSKSSKTLSKKIIEPSELAQVPMEIKFKFFLDSATTIPEVEEGIEKFKKTYGSQAEAFFEKNENSAKYLIKERINEIAQSIVNLCTSSGIDQCVIPKIKKYPYYDFNAKTNGETLLIKAIKLEDISAQQFEKSLELIDALLFAGADAHITDNRDKDALDYALERSDKALRILLKHTITVNWDKYLGYGFRQSIISPEAEEIFKQYGYIKMDKLGRKVYYKNNK